MTNLLFIDYFIFEHKPDTMTQIFALTVVIATGIWVINYYKKREEDYEANRNQKCRTEYYNILEAIGRMRKQEEQKLRIVVSDFNDMILDFKNEYKSVKGIDDLTSRLFADLKKKETDLSNSFSTVS